MFLGGPDVTVLVFLKANFHSAFLSRARLFYCLNFHFIPHGNSEDSRKMSARATKKAEWKSALRTLLVSRGDLVNVVRMTTAVNRTKLNHFNIEEKARPIVFD